MGSIPSLDSWHLCESKVVCFLGTPVSYTENIDRVVGKPKPFSSGISSPFSSGTFLLSPSYNQIVDPNVLPAVIIEIWFRNFNRKYSNIRTAMQA